MVLSHCLEVGLGLVLLISLSGKVANYQDKIINKIQRDKDKIRFLCFNALRRSDYLDLSIQRFNIV